MEWNALGRACRLVGQICAAQNSLTILDFHPQHDSMSRFLGKYGASTKSAVSRMIPALTCAVIRKGSMLRDAAILACAIAASLALAALTTSDAASDLSSSGPTPTPACGDFANSCTTNHPTFTVYVCTRDGFPLLTDVYLKDSSPRPVLIVRGNQIRCKTKDPVGADYHLVVQDIRIPTAGVHDPNFIHSADKDDGHFLLEQIGDPNAFPWCNGVMAMQGASNAGIASYLAAPSATPKLRGIEPSFATGDLLNYGFFNGGVLHHETADLYATSYYPDGGLAWEDYANLPIWETRYLIKDSDASATQVAGFHKSGWFDAFSQGTLDSFSRLQKAGNPAWQNRQKVVIGPWVHGGTVPSPIPISFPSPQPSAPSLLDYETMWKQCVFGVGPTPCEAWENLKAVNVYHMGAPPGTEWRKYDTWPPPATPYPLYFASGNNLVSNTPIPSPGVFVFTSNPNSPCPTLGGTNNLISLEPSLRPGGTSGPLDQQQIEARQTTPRDVAVFTSGPSGPNGTWIVGRIYADVWIETTLPDVDLFIRMTDVYPDGKSILMAQGIQRARYRNGVCPQLYLSPPQRIRIDLGSTALVLPQGHKLRVIVSAAAGPSLNTTNPPLYDINPQNGDDYIGQHLVVRPGTITIQFGGAYPSALVIPVPTGTTLPPDLRPNTTPCPP